MQFLSAFGHVRRYQIAIIVVAIFITVVLHPASIDTSQTQAAQSDWRIVLDNLPGEFKTLSCPDSQHCWVESHRGCCDTSVAYKTSDGGTTWQKWSIPGVYLAITTVAFHDQFLGFAGNDPGVIGQMSEPYHRGLFRTTDGGNTWKRVHAETPELFFIVDSRVIYFKVISKSDTYKSIDSGETWQLWGGSGDRTYYNMIFLDENIAWHASGAVSYTTDGWKTAFYMHPGDRNYGYYSIFFVDYWNGWAGGRDLQMNPLLARTRDAGQNWEVLPIPAHFDSLYFLNSMQGWASAGGQIYGTNDGGYTWQLDAHLSHSVFLVKFHDLNTGWAVTPGKVFKRAPNIALTPTPTTTATPVQPGGCPWTGSWDTTSNGERFYMALTQNGSLVRGTYGTNRTMEGTASGDQLSGRWAGPPTFTEPDNAGRFVFTISTDCNSFTGAWGFGSASSGGGTWSGTRLPPAAELVSQVYWEVLGRAPDADGWRYWSNSGLSREELIAIFVASSEGRRVRAVRNLYVQFLGRDPLFNDNAGLRYWVDSPTTLDEIRAILLDTQERTASVRNLYLEVLARDPLWGDEAGLRFWAQRPVSLNEIRLALQASAEGHHVHAIRRIYIELLGRDPQWTDTAGLRYWVDSGLSLEEIRQIIMQTDEYRRRFGG